MPNTFRVIDTGIRPGRENIAIDQAMIEAHSAGAIGDSIRFLGFPPTVLIGRHQALSQEVALDYCRQHNIGIARRLTGGGAIYFDEGQLGWSLVFHRSSLGITSLDELARAICEAAAVGLSKLGIEARYRPRNDIEVAGLKISGTGGFFDGDCLFYQGTVLVDMDPQAMVAALRVPASKLAKRGIDSAAARIVTLKTLLGDKTPDLESIKAALLGGFRERLGITTECGEVTQTEEKAAKKIFDDEVGTDEFVFEIDAPAASADVAVGEHSGKGGTISCYLRLEGRQQNRIREILFTGDVFVTPPRLIWDLESSLRGVLLDDWAEVLAEFFKRAKYDSLSATPHDFAAAIDAAVNNSGAPKR